MFKSVLGAWQEAGLARDFQQAWDYPVPGKSATENTGVGKREMHS